MTLTRRDFIKGSAASMALVVAGPLVVTGSEDILREIAPDVYARRDMKDVRLFVGGVEIAGFSDEDIVRFNSTGVVA